MRVRVILFSALAAMSQVSAAIDLGEQTETDATAASNTKKPGYHTGNVRVRPSISISQEYNDNIFATDGNNVGDHITVIAPRLKIDSIWDQHQLKFKAGADFGQYWKHDAENFQDYWASVEGRYDFNDRTNLFGGVGMSYEHEGRDSPDANTGGQEPTIFVTHNAHAGVKTRVGDATLRFGGTYEQIDFDNQNSALGTINNNDRDRTLYGLGVRATFPLSESSDVFAQALVDVRDYDQPVDDNGFNRDSEGYRAAVGIKHNFGGDNTAEAYVGVLGQDYEDPSFNDVTELDFGGKLSLRPSADTKLKAQLVRSLNETTDAGSPGYLRTRLSASLEHRITPRLIPQFKASYSVSDYLQTGRDDDVWSAEAAVKYYLTRNSHVLAGIRHVERDSNDVGLLSGSYDYADNILFVNFSLLGYPLRDPAISSFTVDGELSAGLLLLDEDSNRFGRYSGLTDAGLQWDAGLSMHATDGKGQYADLSFKHLGLDSRRLNFDWGSQGKYAAYIRYDQTPHNDFTGETIFNGVGSTRLTLPAGWVGADDTSGMTALSASLHPVEIGTLRKKLAIGGRSFYQNHRWSVALDYETENKTGFEQMAGFIGTAPGNGVASMLPVPVDYTTNTFRAAVGYQTGKTQLQLAYLGDFFYNNLESVHWDNPFTFSGGPVGAEGASSLPPDNQFHQISLSGGHALGSSTRLTGMASFGVMLQDEKFLADTVEPSLLPSPHTPPRDSLEGEIYVYNALLALSSRPLRGLNLKASYRLNKRENNTPVDSFTYYVADSFGGATSSPFTASNQPYSYDKRTAKVEAGYRFNRAVRLNGEASRTTVERSPSEVRETTEDAGLLRLRVSPLDNLQVTLKGGLADRTGSDYITVAGENPLLRKYNISDRERVTGGIDIGFQPTDRLSLNANLDLADNDYDQTQVGLTDSRDAALTLDAAYRFSSELSGHAFVSHERYRSRQAGEQDATVLDGADWWVRNNDRVNTLGLGLDWQYSPKLELSADYVFSDSTGEIDIQSNNALPPVTPFPNLESRTHALRVNANYQLNRRTRLKLSYRYENYDADDWAVDGVNADTIPEVLLMNEDNPSYSQHLVGFYLITEF